VHILLTTDRLILRRFTEADAEPLYQLDNDPEVMRWINGGTPTPREVIEDDMLPGFCRYDEANPAYGFWAAIERRSGAFVGWLCYRRSGERLDEAILGYRFVRSFWGRGYATEGARALLRLGFVELGVRRVVASTYEHNAASRRVMEKLGMALVRCFRITPQDMMDSDTSHSTSLEVWDGDEVEYAITRAAWAQRAERDTPPAN